VQRILFNIVSMLKISDGSEGVLHKIELWKLLLCG